jgi:hypothetical protein
MLTLMDQAQSLLQVEAYEPAFSAFWLVRTIALEIGDNGRVEQMNGVFTQAAQQVGDAWPALEARLKTDAEGMRLKGVAWAVQQVEARNANGTQEENDGSDA